MNLSISGLFILAFVCLQGRAFAYRTYKCEENYVYFHKWYMEESKVFHIKNKNILLNWPNSGDGGQLTELMVDVGEEDFQSFCRFYNERADKNTTYSPCNDQRYDVKACFRRFIELLNENVNQVVERYIEYRNLNNAAGDLNRSQICNYTALNEHTYSTRDFYEQSCYACIAGLQSKLMPSNCSSLQASNVMQKCCMLFNLIHWSKTKNQIDQIFDLNKELIAGKYNTASRNLKPSKQICQGAHSPATCVCPRGYVKDSQKGSHECLDQDECADSPDASYCSLLDRELNQKYNLAGNRNLTRSLCVNTFGKFLCVRIECPANYELKNNKCYYNHILYSQLRSEELFSTAKIIAFEFISLPKNVYIEPGKPLELFRIDQSPDADYNYKIHKVNSIHRNVNELDSPYIVKPDLNGDQAELFDHFSLQLNNRTKQATLFLNKEINSLAEAQVVLLASWHSHDHKNFGITYVVLNIYVTN